MTESDTRDLCPKLVPKRTTFRQFVRLCPSYYPFGGRSSTHTHSHKRSFEQVATTVPAYPFYTGDAGSSQPRPSNVQGKRSAIRALRIL